MKKNYPFSWKKIMRISSVILFSFMCCLGVATAKTADGQISSKKVSLKIEPGSLNQALDQIRRQEKITFFYDTDVLKKFKVPSANYKNVPLYEILHELLRGTPMDFIERDKGIIIRIDEQQVALGSAIREIIIKGSVKDSLGTGLPGVSVYVKSQSNKGTATNSNGDFALRIPSADVTLVFSLIGYQTKEVTLNGQQAINVVLREEKSNLSEVIVVGYGTQKKANLTGAVAVVSGKDIEGRPASTMSQLLQGTVPNMTITFGSGRPGEGGKFNIRGVNSISNSAVPLVLIDGIEGSIDRVNPHDVESVTVLKDASAAAVYGARASYGVILVTTKKGEPGKTTLNYSGKYAQSASTTSTDYENRGFYSASINDLFYEKYAGKKYTNYNENDYYQLWIRRNDKTENPERPWVTIDQRDGRDTYVYYGNTDWYNYLYDDKRPLYEHSVSLNGSSDKVSYFLSGNLFEQKGMLKMNKDKFTKYNMRSKISYKIKDWLEISNNTSYYKSSYFYPGASGVASSFNSTNVHALASFVPRNPDGTLVYNNSLSPNGVMDGISALLTHDGHRNEDQIHEFAPSFEAVIKPLKGLDFRANYSFIHYNYQNMNRGVNVPYSKYPGEISYITTGVGLNRLYETQTNHWYKAFNAYGTYEHSIKEKHNFKIMAGYNYETKFLKDLKMERQGLLTDILDDFDLAKGDVMSISGGKNRYALMGTFYRFNYDYKGKYLFETSGRYDGSSRFQKDDRWGFFPSFSAGWRLDEEAFFQPLKPIINSFKIRASYGSLGNQQVGYYDYIQTINTGGNDGTLNYTFTDGIKAPSATETAPNASNLTWEKVSTSNLGVDVELLKQRLSITADVYVRDTRDMLMAGKTLPSVYGANSPKENAADLRTKGWEASMTWRDEFAVAGKPFKYNVTVGLGDNTARITRFDNPNKKISDFYEGQKLGEIWGYVVDGYFLSDAEAASYPVDQTAVNTIINSSANDVGVRAGDLKFVDLDGDNKISLGANTVDSPGDRKVIGNSMPRYNYGVNLGSSWNGIDVSVFVQGIGKQNWYPGTDASVFWGPYARPYASFIPSDFLSKVWSPENPNAYFPRPRGYVALNKDNRSLGVANTKYIQDLAYARVKNITVGYTLPKYISSKISLSRCRIYFSGENLFTFTKLESDFIDPEQASTANTFNVSTSTARVYPWAKTFSFGLDISL
jgi:TonB-linked SusC/RagA family outer membrane protein